MKKRLLSFLLAIIMVLSVFPMTVFAENEEIGNEESITEEIIEEIAEEATKTPTEEISEEIKTEEELEENKESETPAEEPAEEPEEEPEKEVSEEVEPLEELLTEEASEDIEPEGEIIEKKEFFAGTTVTSAEAFEAALTAGGEIKLGADITYANTSVITGAIAIFIDKDTIIDLNGHTLTLNTTSDARYSISVGKYDDKEHTLVIKDSSQNGEGILNVYNAYTSAKSYLIDVYGTLDIQGGTINQTASKASSYGINMETSGTFKMSGGKLNKGTSLDTTGYTLRGTSGTIIITGGVIEEYSVGNNASGWEVSGGVFKTEPTYEMMKTGFVTYKITDEGATKGWYGVKEGTYVGLVGTTVYTDVASFAKAIANNQDGKITVEGTKLTLTDDLNLGTGTATKVTFLTNLTLDLAGHDITAEITGSGSTATVFLFYVNKNDAVVTITDSEGGGMIQNAKAGATAQVSVQTIGANKGTFVIENVTVDATITASTPTNTLFSYPTPVSSLTADGRIILNGATINAVGQTCRASAIGVSDNGYCEIDNTTINVSTESSGKGIVSKSSSGTLKIGSKNIGKTKINVHGYGNEPSYASTYLNGITNSDSSGASGAVTIANTDVSIVSKIGSGTKPQICQGIFLADTSSGVKEIGDNVSVSISGQSAQTGTYPEIYGIRAAGGGDMTGTNVSIEIAHESAMKTYGIYLNGTNDFVINPGTNVFVDVTEAAGTVYKVFAFSSGKIKIADGLYTGGDMVGVIATGGVFDQNPATSCDLGYVAQKDTPKEGLWTVVPDTRTIVKNLTQDKEYGNIVTAVAEAKDNDELQLLEDISSNAELTLASINLDLNGHKLALNILNTKGNVTITDKQATSFDNAGTLTASINVGAGQTTISKCNHALTTNTASYPFTTGGTADTQAQLTISGVKGNYNCTSTSNYDTIYAKDNSSVTIDNAEGFETNLAQQTSVTSYLIYGKPGSPVIINGGEFSLSAGSNSAFLFYKDTVALVKDGKFNLSGKTGYVKIANGTSSTVNIQGGYYAPKVTGGDYIAQNTFFANATTLGVSNGKSAAALEETDPMYEAGYRYTVEAVAVATANSGQEYFSLEAAINAAANTDKTVKLLADVVLTEYTLDKDVTFEANGHTVKLNGDKPLTLAAGIELPDCFDVSSAAVYIEKKTGEKVYYKDLGSGSTPGALPDYNADDDKQIVLTKDKTVGSALLVYKTCTIDLNGFSINGNGCQSETFNIRKGSNQPGPTVCTIKDSSDNKTGKITGNNDKYYTVLIEGTGNALVLESGTIENTSENGAGICAMDSYGYNICKDATITINGGKIVTNKGFAIVDNGQASQNIAININGGEIQSTGVAIYHPADGVMTLSGGKITGGTGIYMRSGKLVVPADSDVQVFANGAKGGRNEVSGAAYMTGDAVVIDNTQGYPGGAVSADVKGGRFASDNAKAMASYKTGSVSAISGFLTGGYYSSRPDMVLIRAGYSAVVYKDTENYPELHWVIGDIPEINVGEATVNEDSGTIAINDTQITVKDENGEPVASQDVATAITETLNNKEVSDFMGTNIDAATEQNKTIVQGQNVTYAMKALLEQTTSSLQNTEGASVELTAEGKLRITSGTGAVTDEFSESDIKKQVTVDMVTSSVSGSGENTTVNSATFEVKPVGIITTLDANGDAVVFKATIPNDGISSDITFRMPVDSKITSTDMILYHSESKENLKQDCLGIFPILEENGKKFIQLSAGEFSYFTYEDLNMNENTAAVIVDNAGIYTGYETLAAAITAFNGSGEGAVANAVSIILLKDVNGSTNFDSKVVKLNLNGHIFAGSVTNAESVTVQNSDTAKQKTLAATGTYANDVSAFVMDGFDVKKTTVDNDTVFNNTAAGIFSVVVVPVPGSYTDRDSVTEGIDLYAGDTVKMDVRVYGAKFVGADVTLYYDKTNFKMIDATISGWDGDVKIYDNEEKQVNLKGKTRFYAAKSTQGGASEYYNLNKIDNEGNMYYSLGTFEFEALPGAAEALNVAFQVEPIATGEIGRDGTTTGQDVAPVYVAGAWSQGWNDTPANQLATGADDTHLVNALVNVRLKSMSAVVNGETGLVYNASARNLVKSGAGAKDSITQNAIENPTITYAVVTKAEADAEDFNASTLTYTDAIPQKTDAGDYVVFYRVSQPGYITVADKLNVSIAKKDVDLNWTCTEPMTTGDGKSEDYVSNFKVTYNDTNTEGFAAPTATYPNAGGNGNLNATVTLTGFNDAAPAEGTQLIKVGKYVYTATVDPNYNIKSGETAVVELEGSVIIGYTLTAKNNTEAAPTIGNVWYDDAAHTPAQLNTAAGATEDVTIKYHTLAPGATEWTVSNTIPEFTAAGTYQVKAVLTKDSYYDLTLDTVTFTIKSANYVVEKFDWVTGWDVVLVYTNDTVPGFTYEGAKMYDVSKLGYKYGTTKNADGTVGTQAYTHVFGLVVFGDADITKVTSSNETALDIDYSPMEGNMPSGVAKARLDVNSSTSVELLDLVFVQGVYNVNETYMAQQMAIVLKSDVNGDKMVDTRDCALIKANS